MSTNVMDQRAALSQVRNPQMSTNVMDQRAVLSQDFIQPKRTIPVRHMVSTNNPLKTTNQFHPLSNMIDSLPPISREHHNAINTCPAAAPQTSHHSVHRRPNICCTENHLNNFKPIRPGNLSYSNAAKRGRRVLVLSDSMLQRIRKREFYTHLPNAWGQIKSFPGANANHLHHHVLPSLIENCPNTLVIHGGTNNLRDSDNPTINIVKELIGIGETARNFGVDNIIFSGLTIRKDGLQIDRKRRELNRILKSKCMSIENFAFVSNDNILLDDVSDDRVHLLESGNIKLANNILHVLNGLP
jgi:hypothetical protein